MPQFDASGGDVAAPAYLALLVRGPRRGQAADPEVTVWRRRAGAARDRPAGTRAGTRTRRRRSSGTSARAFRASGPRGAAVRRLLRSTPTRRARAIPPDRPTDPKSKSILMADYEEKLRPLLDEAFGPGVPVLYSELGVETTDPAGEGARCTTGESAGAGRSTRRRRPTSTAGRWSSRPARGRRRPAALPLPDEPKLSGLPVAASTTWTGPPKSSLEPVARRGGTYDMPEQQRDPGRPVRRLHLLQADPPGGGCRSRSGPR